MSVVEGELKEGSPRELKGSWRRVQLRTKTEGFLRKTFRWERECNVRSRSNHFNWTPASKTLRDNLIVHPNTSSLISFKVRFEFEQIIGIISSRLILIIDTICLSFGYLRCSVSIDHRSVLHVKSRLKTLIEEHGEERSWRCIIEEYHDASFHGAFIIDCQRPLGTFDGWVESLIELQYGLVLSLHPGNYSTVIQ